MKNIMIGLVSLVMAVMLTGCIRLEVATPDKPINIDMNVKIDHEINVKVDKQVEDELKKTDVLSL